MKNNKEIMKPVNKNKVVKPTPKLTKKDYMAKYIFFKILFGEFQINDFVYSESQMSTHFKTTNATVRVAYNNLIQRGILKAIKGKGYIVLKNIGSYMFEHFENLSRLKFTKKQNVFTFYQGKNPIIKLTFTSIFVPEPQTITNLLDLFKQVFCKLEIDEVTLNKTYASTEKEWINHYIYSWNGQIILDIELKSQTAHVAIFNYQKQLPLK